MANLSGMKCNPIKSISHEMFLTVCFPDTWDQMCSNQEKQGITFSIVEICMQELHYPVWIFQLSHVGWHHKKHNSKKISYMRINTPELVSKGTFLCLLYEEFSDWNLGHCSLKNQYNTSMHPLKLLKLWSTSEYS